MKTLFLDFIAGLKSLITLIETKLESFGSELVTIWEESYPPAAHQAILDLLPLGSQIIKDLQNQGGLSGKEIASEALSQMETALVSAGKDFVITFAIQAIAIIMQQQGVSTAAGNGGNLPGGNSNA